METGLELEKNEPIVIADECGDSMWSAVLLQEVEGCDEKAVSRNAASLLHYIDVVPVDCKLRK